MSTFAVVVKGARIIRFEKGKKVAYGPGAKIELNEAEADKYKFITSPVAAKQEVRHAVPPAIDKK